jgi:hypothetical protein
VIVRRRWGACAAGVVLLQFVSLAGAGAAPPGTSSAERSIAGHRVGLGKVLSTADGGQIFGWDINTHGTDGVLTTSQDVNPPGAYKVSVETFDQTTGKITHVFARHSGKRHSYLGDGIFAGDVALITHYVTPHGTIYANRHYKVMNPVTAESFTGAWTPPVKDFDVIQNAENQSTATSVVYGIQLNDGDLPALAVTDLTQDTSKFIQLDPNRFGIGHTQVAQDSATNQAVLASSDGAVGGPPPVNTLIDLSTGKLTQWNGLNNGPFGAGFVNGLAVDSRTGIACTTTELNAQVEFYDLAKKTGKAMQLPGTGDSSQLNSGAAVASDPVHKLFLVADPVFAPTGNSAIVVYDEDGNLVESIPGFDFSNRFAVVPIRVAVNPKLRMGWVDGPGIDQLQQFFY